MQFIILLASSIILIKHSYILECNGHDELNCKHLYLLAGEHTVPILMLGMIILQFIEIQSKNQNSKGPLNRATRTY